MDRDAYAVGKPLSRRGLFQLITDEVFKDGRVEAWENSVLNKLSRFLCLDQGWAKKIAKRSAKKFKDGELGSKRPMHASRLYERTLFFVWSDGVLDGAEQKMLHGLRMFFNISSKSHREMLRFVQTPEYRERYRPEQKPYTKPSPEESLHLLPPGGGKSDDWLAVELDDDLLKEKLVEEELVDDELVKELDEELLDDGLEEEEEEEEKALAASAAAPVAEGSALNGSVAAESDITSGTPIFRVAKEELCSRVSKTDFDALRSKIKQAQSLQGARAFDESDLREIESIALDLARYYRFVEERRRPALTLLSHLAPLLVMIRRVEYLRDSLLLFQTIDDLWDEHPEIFRATLINSFAPLEDGSSPKTVIAVLDAFQKVVEGGSSEDYRWSSFADACAKGGFLLSKAESWEEHRKVLRYFRATPDDQLEASAAQWSSTLMAWIYSHGRIGDYSDCQKGFEAFERLLDFLSDAEVRRSYSRILLMMIEYLGEDGGASELFERQADLTLAYLADSQLAPTYIKGFALAFPMLEKQDKAIEVLQKLLVRQSSAKVLHETLSKELPSLLEDSRLSESSKQRLKELIQASKVAKSKGGDTSSGLLGKLFNE